MQLKGLVRFFAILLVIICLYQLSFTWMVRSYESTQKEKAAAWVKANYPAASVKYPGDAERAAAYEDSLSNFEKARLQRILDSTADTKIGPFSLATYKGAKDEELKLGLDLQGGMSVTMEVGLDGLIRSLSNYSKDAAFNTALNNAVVKKANSGLDLITLFGDEYKKVGNGNKLAPLFLGRSDGKVKFDDSDDKVLSYLRAEAGDAFNNTFRILSNRIDRFGLASPSINPDPAKGIINIELAGIKDPERVRKYLQSTANLQFFEVFTVNDAAESLQSADKAMSDYLKGIKTTPDTAATAVAKSDTTKQVTAVVDTTKTFTLSGGSADTAKNKTTAKTTDSTKIRQLENPIFSLFRGIAQGQQDEKGAVHYPAYIGYVLKRDTGQLGTYLRSDVVASKLPANMVFMYGNVEGQAGVKNDTLLSLYAIKTLDNGLAKLEGNNVSTARQDYDEKGRPAISMNMDAVGTRIWAKMTADNVGKPIAIVLDNFVYSAPNVINAIPNGNSQISGSFTIQEAKDLADILQSGKLPAPAKIVAEQVVGPTLGEAAVTGGALAFLISFIVIFVLMLIYYNTAGWVANIALILNLLFTIGILAMFGFTLTAPGIAGLVLTIGMAVDTNVIIFERIKEELTKGKGYLMAVSDGYKRSYAPVLDAHVTTFLTAFILFIFGLGPVLGFATTQMLGIVLSLFCGILVSRMITDLFTNKQRHFEYFTGISKKIFKHTQFKFIEYRKIAYGISVVVLILGIASLFNGFDEGVEFSGGRSYTVKFAAAPNVEQVRTELEKVFEEAPIIKTVNTNDQLNITTSYKIKETGNNVDSLVVEKLYTGLQKFIPGTSLSQFKNPRVLVSSQKVLPSISEDLKRGATKATVIAIIVICLYIFIRFRDWRYSLGTIVSLLHDVLVTLAVFSFARYLDLGFSLEIDQYFIAAVLTVIGFSMNDTVIVYDRIREDSKLMKGADKATIINTAINQTLSRTIMTSLTVFLTILILFIFGGEVTKGFAFAMLIGVITGTYSSIFVAAPILVDFARNRPLGKQEEVKVKLEKPVATKAK
ncbi:protein translocase subunit SecDF [Panacibacter ginsenosidivorans]|uniref:Multifunctional fusion protein n=1 Tax=Panacibacter ginsenosidivorans TaxID=1813871 RepID=A0A5B8VE89_9BACT|nr:protein translocase subunit SecDF [Panacibacter ginsenosidivorans]QEC69579.1 protein translocase subunit SecDF [Panacibacter ginsenosidivorans]